MKPFVLLLAALVLAPAAAAQRAWIVDNDLTHAADFRTVQAAIDGVQAGDTIYVAGSATPYAGFNVTRRVVLIGTGYFLPENYPGTYFNDGALISGAVTFAAPGGGLQGAAGSTMYGFDIIGLVTVRADVLVTRNRLRAQWLDVFCKSSLIGNAVGSVNIAQNEPTCNINETIVNANITYSHQGSGYSISASTPDNAIIYIVNNTTTDPQYGNIRVNRALVQNNILRSGNIQGNVRTTALYNMGAGNVVGPNVGQQDGNYNNVGMTAVFVGGTSPDGQWQLAPNSPARGVGFQGADLGAYGSSEPYRISGLPPVPLIYEFTTGTSTAAGLPVLVRVRVAN